MQFLINFFTNISMAVGDQNLIIRLQIFDLHHTSLIKRMSNIGIPNFLSAKEIKKYLF